MQGQALTPRCSRLLPSHCVRYIHRVAVFASPAPIVHQLQQVDADSPQALPNADPLPKATVTLSNNNPKHSETELVLDMAQHDLAELCSENGSTECWKALDYFVSKRRQYVQHCDLEHELRDTSSCNALNGLEKFTREQMTTGSVANLKNNLLIMQRAEERRAAREEATVLPLALSDAEIHERARLIRLFHAIDANGVGDISMLEFQDGLEALGAVLTENDIQQISDALSNSNNRLDIDDFMEVMDASPLLRGVAIGNDTNFLRHVSHPNGAPHSHHAGSVVESSP